MRLAVWLAATLALTGCSAVFARSQDEEMLRLSPETRIEQRCDARAMGVVRREHKGQSPDEFVAYAFSDPVIRGNRIKADGGAVRSNGKWFRLSYDCTTSPDGLDVKAFSYRLGAQVPRSEWDAHYLVAR